MLARRALASVAVGATLSALAYAQSKASSTKDVAVYSEAQAKRGAVTYLQSCSGCHLYDLSGGKDPDGLGDAPPLIGEQFERSWQDETMASLLNVVRATMPFDKPGELAPNEYADVVAYILSVNKLPAGEREFGQDSAALQGKLFGEKR